jgi:hypothetical protein
VGEQAEEAINVRRYLPYILYAIIVIGLVAAIVFAFNADDPASKTDKKKPATTSEEKKTGNNQSGDTDSGNSAGSVAQKPNPTYTPPVSTPSSSGSSSSSSSSSSTASQRQSADASSQAGKSGQQLANSGPRETFALFVGVTLLGAVAFSGYQRRQFSA